MPEFSQPKSDHTQEDCLIELRNIHLSYGDDVVLNGVDLTVCRNEIVAVVGPSGTGKSTLIKIISGLLQPDEGDVTLHSDAVGLAFQYGALFTSFTVGENLAFVLERVTDLDDAAIDARITESLELVGLSEERDKLPSELSGGMQKRVGIARALAIHPDIMLYDEPSAGLDPILANKLEHELVTVNRQRRMATVVVTHELPTIETMADRVVLLYHGKIVYQGTQDDFMQTRQPYALQFRTRREAGPIEVST